MSIYAITPLAVVRPEGPDDVARLLRFCSDERIAVRNSVCMVVACTRKTIVPRLKDEQMGPSD